MTQLSEIVDYLDDLLDTDAIPDYPQAINGLQLANRSGEVTKIACAVDATAPMIEKALAVGADFLIVHHGLFWQGAQPLRGRIFEKYANAIEGGLAIYSSHIPLDVHPEFGNNARLAHKVRPAAEWQPAFDWKGIKLGLAADLANVTFGELANAVERAVGTRLLGRFGSESSPAGKTLVITGGAGSEIGAVAAAGYDTLISGEAPHWAHGMSEEAEVNLILGGHYATETFGVKALGEHLEGKFGENFEFLDHPSGL